MELRLNGIIRVTSMFGRIGRLIQRGRERSPYIHKEEVMGTLGKMVSSHKPEREDSPEAGAPISDFQSLKL